MTDTPPVVDTVVGIAYQKDQSIWIEERNINEILDSYVGYRVKMMISHKPDVGPKPPFLWSVQQDGVLCKVDEEYFIGETPFALDPMAGFNCIVTLVNLDFEIVPLGDLGTASQADFDQIAEREERLRSALQNLGNVLESLSGQKQ